MTWVGVMSVMRDHRNRPARRVIMCLWWCQLALYNLVARVRFSRQRRAAAMKLKKRSRRRARCHFDLLLRISVFTLVGTLLKTVWLVDPFGTLGIFNNAVRTALDRIPEVLGCLCLASVREKGCVKRTAPRHSCVLCIRAQAQRVNEVTPSSPPL